MTEIKEIINKVGKELKFNPAVIEKTSKTKIFDLEKAEEDAKKILKGIKS